MNRSLDRIAAILDCFSRSDSRLSAAQIADRSRLDRATTLRFLGAMESQRIVRRDPVSRLYSPGSRLIRWGNIASESIDVRVIAEPFMTHLNALTGETIALYVCEGDNRICVATHESVHEIRHVLPIGNALPLTVAAGGRAILAGMPADRAEEIIDLDPSLSEPDRREIRAQLPEIRRQGYALGIHLMTPHAWSMAAPIHDRSGDVIAVLVISGPDVRISDVIARQHAAHLVPAAQEISVLLGAPEPAGGSLPVSAG